jgi:ribose transport system substrate-binding protein
MTKMSVRITKLFLIPAVVIMLALAACSSGTSPGDSAGSSGAKLKSGKVGVLLSSATTQLTAQADVIKRALGDIGWTTTVSDGRNNPAVQQSSLQDFVQQKVQGIITISITSAVVAPQLQQAKAAGMPVISLSDDANPNAFAANYGGDPGQQAKLTVDYVKGKVPPGSSYVTLDISAVYAIHQFITTTTPLLDAAGYKRVGNYDINLSDLTNSVKTGALNLIQAHPDTRLLYGCSSVCIPIVAAAFQQAGIHNVQIIANSFQEDKPSFAVIAAGNPVAANIQNLTLNGLIAVDQILKHQATGAEVDRKANAGVYQSIVIDKTNVPSSGVYAGTTADEQAHFDNTQLIAKYANQWKQTYGLAG